MINHTHEVSFGQPSQLFVEEARERFDIEKYAQELLLGTIYVDATTEEEHGVRWEETPSPFEFGQYDDPVDELPADLIPPSNLEE